MTVKDNTYGQAALQDVMLEILKYFISICKKYNLSYSLSGGTVLGALRHGGFIPWDDDLDVQMPRPDYEKLWELAPVIAESEKYILCRTSREKNYHHRVMQLVDLETTFINNRSINEDIEHGIYIDIIPVDACPKNPIKRLSQIINAIIYSVYNIQCRPEFHKGLTQKVLDLGTRVLLKLVQDPDARFRIWKRCERKMVAQNWESADQCVLLVAAFHLMFRPMPITWCNTRSGSFEDIVVELPSEAEAYCKQLYGDYMALPPSELRKPQHNTTFVDLNTPYTSYKGIYYCKRSALA